MADIDQLNAERLAELHKCRKLVQLSHCRVCGKPIAATQDMLCCEHRYEKKIRNDLPPREIELVERFQGYVGQRILDGFRMIWKDNE